MDAYPNDSKTICDRMRKMFNRKPSAVKEKMKNLRRELSKVKKEVDYVKVESGN
jgi:hypothetical protein